MKFCEVALVKNYKFESEKELAKYILNYYNKQANHDFYTMAIIGYYGQFTEIIKEFIAADNYIIYADYGDPDWSGYAHEYILEISDKHISIEKLYNVDTEKYVNIEIDDVFVFSDTEYIRSAKESVAKIEVEPKLESKCAHCVNKRCNHQNNISQDNYNSEISLDDLYTIVRQLLMPNTILSITHD